MTSHVSPYLVAHVGYVLSHQIADSMYIELISLNLLDQMIRLRKSDERRLLGSYEKAYVDILEHEKRLTTRQDLLIPETIRLIQHIFEPDRKKIRQKRYSKNRTIADIEKSVETSDSRYGAETGRMVEKAENDIRLVSKLSG